MEEQRNLKSCPLFFLTGPCPHFSERGQHAQISPLCLVRHQEAGTYNDPWSFQHCDDHDQVHELATAVFQIRGLIKGRTLLPFPQVCLK